MFLCRPPTRLGSEMVKLKGDEAFSASGIILLRWKSRTNPFLFDGWNDWWASFGSLISKTHKYQEVLWSLASLFNKHTDRKDYSTFYNENLLLSFFMFWIHELFYLHFVPLDSFPPLFYSSQRLHLFVLFCFVTNPSLVRGRTVAPLIHLSCSVFKVQRENGQIIVVLSPSWQQVY